MSLHPGKGPEEMLDRTALCPLALGTSRGRGLPPPWPEAELLSYCNNIIIVEQIPVILRTAGARSGQFPSLALRRRWNYDFISLQL